MAKGSVKSAVDVLVLGCHPSAFFAVALLKQGTGLNVMHAGLANDRYPDRLVIVNPQLFALHPILEELKPALDLTPMKGLRFLADDAATSNNYSSKETAAYVCGFKQFQSALQKKAAIAGESIVPLVIHGVDESGVDVTVGKVRCRPKLILLAGPLPHEQQQMLGLPSGWDSGIVHRYSFARIKPSKALPQESSQTELIPMSLDVDGTMRWAWLLATPKCIQLAIEQPLADATDARVATILQRWADVLASHGYLKKLTVDPSSITSIDLPFAGALSQELVANRTLLFGPAGGFYTACAEDVYPCCWSAMFAVAAAKSAVKERFVQDALQVYRQKWGGSLGDYLRGPQQNLKFLLPLVYRNSTMAARLAEAILSGASVVR